MNRYSSDNWVVLKSEGDDPHYRVLAGTSGGYTTGSSWRLNSGIVHVDEYDDRWLFYGMSGSCYICRKHSYAVKMNIAQPLEELKSTGWTLMPEDTNWLDVNWLIQPKTNTKPTQGDC